MGFAAAGAHVGRNSDEGFLEDLNVWERMWQNSQKLKGMAERKGMGRDSQAQHLDWKSPTQQTIFSHLSAEEKRSCGEFLVDKQDHIKGIPDATIKATRETSRWLLP